MSTDPDSPPSGTAGDVLDACLDSCGWIPSGPWSPFDGTTD